MVTGLLTCLFAYFGHFACVCCFGILLGLCVYLAGLSFCCFCTSRSLKYCMVIIHLSFVFLFCNVQNLFSSSSSSFFFFFFISARMCACRSHVWMKVETGPYRLCDPACLVCKTLALGTLNPLVQSHEMSFLFVGGRNHEQNNM